MKRVVGRIFDSLLVSIKITALWWFSVACLLSVAWMFRYGAQMINAQAPMLSVVIGIITVIVYIPVVLVSFVVRRNISCTDLIIAEHHIVDERCTLCGWTKPKPHTQDCARTRTPFVQNTQQSFLEDWGDGESDPAVEESGISYEYDPAIGNNGGYVSSTGEYVSAHLVPDRFKNH